MLTQVMPPCRWNLAVQAANVVHNLCPAGTAGVCRHTRCCLGSRHCADWPQHALGCSNLRRSDTVLYSL
jgi:hypothetical protein